MPPPRADPDPGQAEIAARLKREHRSAPVLGGASPGESTEHSALRHYVRDLILGFNDGVVSVYAVVAGLAGASLAGAALDARLIAIAGVAASVAGALSMGIGEYVSTKGQAEYYDSERRREREHIERYPELETRELREFMEARGLKGELLDRVVETIAADRERFLDVMMREEFGMGTEVQRSPLRAMGLVMAAFLAGAVLAVTPFFLAAALPALTVATVLSLGGLFTAGATRGIVSGLSPLRSGVEMVVLGGAAALVTYAVGSWVGVAL